MAEKQSKSGVGGKREGAGRKPGIPNKVTTRAKEAFADLLENNADKLQSWLDDIATNEKHGPKAAFECLLQIAEFNIPKLARTEVVGDEKAPQRMVVSWKK